MPELLDESGTFPPHATAMRISSELTEAHLRSAQEGAGEFAEVTAEPTVGPEPASWKYEHPDVHGTVATIELQDRRREVAIREVREMVYLAKNMGDTKCSMTTFTGKGVGTKVEFPVFEGVRDELIARGYAAVLETRIAESDHRARPAQPMAMMTLSVDWSEAGPGIGPLEPAPIPESIFDEDVQLAEQQRAMRLMLDNEVHLDRNLKD